MSADNVIHCANCRNCLAFTDRRNGANRRRVRCSKGHWAKPLGEAKNYNLYTILRRTVRQCDDYDSMGEHDRDEFLADLEINLGDEAELARGE